METLSRSTPLVQPAKTFRPDADPAQLQQDLQHLLEDKRGQHKAIPINIGCYLNDQQRVALHSLESFGWHLWFVRRPLFMRPLVVVINPGAKHFAVLEDDGSVNTTPQVPLRAD